MGGSIRPWQRIKFARKDGVHLSRRGYQRIADLFEQSLLITYERWKRAQGTGESIDSKSAIKSSNVK